MSVIHNDLLLSTDEATGYNLTKSLRTRASASAYLNRTPASAGNRQTWTWSGWVKRGKLTTGAIQGLFAGNGSSNTIVTGFRFTATDNLEFISYNSGYTQQVVTTQVFRDPSAWYHLMAVLDTTQATASNRAKIYVNGQLVTALSTATYPSQNYDAFVNTTNLHVNGAALYSGVIEYLDGYMAEVNFIDGQALTPSSFGETDTITGVWKPKRYTGTYGTNGFYLPFTDVATTSGSNAGLGKDFSGNGNYWTTNNISVTAGVTYDSMTDVPTLTSATQANYCVLNPLAKNASATLLNGNLAQTTTNNTDWRASLGTIGFSSGKYYWEMTTAASNPATMFAGISGITIPYETNNLQDASSTLNTHGSLIFCDDGKYQLDGAARTTYSSALTANQVLGIAVDMDAKSLTFYKDGTSLGAISFSSSAMSSKVVCPFFISINSASTYTFNFGQRPFSYTPPTGYVALNTYNLPDSTIVAGNKVMDATTYTATGTTQVITNAGGFKPDLVWVKGRSMTSSNYLMDSVRGSANYISSNQTSAEATDAQFLASFNSNGFTFGTSNYANGSSMVGWQWQAGQGTTSSNTSGSITSTVSVNASAGFSIVTYTSPASGNFTIGHGLGVAPSLIINKARSTTGNWLTWHKALPGGTSNYTYYMVLNLNDAVTSVSDCWGNAPPNSTTFGLQANYSVAGNTDYVSYCWSEIAGFSKFGSYTGNGSTDGPFVYTGFRPKFVMIKCTNLAGSYWVMQDTSRNTYNVINSVLYPNASASEATTINIDALSNGFKLRTLNSDYNNSGSDTYIYMAFAENPFKNSLAR
jgi:hypothetical protein